MPVTIKLSKKFYDTFGDELTNELVGVLNGVDATYRNDLRQLNELNFTRFEATLGERVAQLDKRIAEAEARVVRWMAGLLVPTLIGVVGIAVGIFLRR